MRVKATQVRAMAQFQDHVLRTRRRRDRLGRLLPLSSRQRKIREGFYQFLKQLNRRGPKAVPERPRFHTRTQEARIVSTEYLAGFIDAEGSLMLSKAKKVIRWNPAYAVKVYVDNTNKVILEEIQRSYQGTITTQPARKAAWKRSYKLVWTGRRAERLLSLVEPHLHVKRSHAKTLLQFIGHKEKTKQRRDGSGFARLPATVLRYKESAYRRMRELNAKGVALSRVAATRAPARQLRTTRTRPDRRSQIRESRSRG